MSGSTSVAASGGGGDGYMAPFTAVQWQELEHQALIYKYLVAGVPVPSDLVLPIRRSLQALSARLLHHPALGYCSYNGKKYDPEPWRCRRTDGKKWRCSKEAFQESKYCERHMNRGRNRSRKPVESQSTSSHSLSTDVTMNSTCGRKGSYQNVGGSTSSSQSLYSITNSESYDFGNDGSKLQMGSIPYAINSKDLRHSQQVDTQDYTSGVATSSDNSWRLIPSQILKHNNSNNSNPMINDPNPISSKHQHSSSLLPWSETWCPQPISMVHPGFDATNASSSSTTTSNGVFLYGYIQ